MNVSVGSTIATFSLAWINLHIELKLSLLLDCGSQLPDFCIIFILKGTHRVPYPGFSHYRCGQEIQDVGGTLLKLPDECSPWFTVLGTYHYKENGKLLTRRSCHVHHKHTVQTSRLDVQLSSLSACVLLLDIVRLAISLMKSFWLYA